MNGVNLFGKKKILIIEDEPELANALKIRLQAKGYKADTANDGLAGWEAVQSVKPDLVLLDLMLPVMDGYEVCRYIKGDKKTKNIPVIMLTAKSVFKDVDKGFSVGADDYIIKPYDLDMLLKKIERLI
jgi:DNA-binding response OmpR family regulator